MPYRIDVPAAPPGALDVLVELGALDVEPYGGGLAAIIPDGVAPGTVAARLGAAEVAVSSATARDSGSVWLLRPRAVLIGGVWIAPAEADAPPEALRLADSGAFGTGYHPTTALCLEALEEILTPDPPGGILDVGTGSGILALAALKMGVPQAVGLDTAEGALRAAAENARVNNVADRLRLVLGGPDAVDGNWPVVVANLLAAPLMEMAPVLVRRVGTSGRLILSGIHSSLESEVREVYRHLGITHFASKTRAGWTALIGRASW